MTDDITKDQVASLAAAMPEWPDNTPLKYYASGKIEADWARRHYPGMKVVIKPRIPR
jgi:hypothetical protein